MVDDEEQDKCILENEVKIEEDTQKRSDLTDMNLALL